MSSTTSWRSRCRLTLLEDWTLSVDWAEMWRPGGWRVSQGRGAQGGAGVNGIPTTRGADQPRYAAGSRWGQFARRLIRGCPVHCGLCGDPFTTQPAKASHLRIAHRADVETTRTAAGEPVYEWDRS